MRPAPRHAGRVGSAAARYARRCSANPPSTPRFARREHWRKRWNYRLRKAKTMVSFCREATYQHLTQPYGVIFP